MKSTLATVVVLVLVSLAFAGACTRSKEDQLVAARRERRVIIDKLYEEYGGGALAAEVKKEADRGAAEIAREPPREGKDAAVEVMKMMGNAAGEVDRAAFEVQCLTLGEGDRPIIINDKAKQFFSSSATEKQCIEVAQLGRKIAELEKELGVKPEAP